MHCLKCGKETGGSEVFCGDCLSNMAHYPVAPGTAIQLPNRKESSVEKKPVQKRPLTPEQQLSRLRQAYQRLSFVALLLAVFLGISMILLVRAYG